MIRHEHERLVYFTYHLFTPFDTISNVVSSRLGGVSEGHLRSLNISFRVGDEEQAVLTNRSRFYHAVDVEPETVAQAQLVHGTHIAIVTDQSPLGLHHRFAETDGLVTNIPNRALFIPVADCAAVAFFDPKQRVI